MRICLVWFALLLMGGCSALGVQTEEPGSGEVTPMSAEWLARYMTRIIPEQATATELPADAEGLVRARYHLTRGLALSMLPDRGHEAAPSLTLALNDPALEWQPSGQRFVEALLQRSRAEEECREALSVTGAGLSVERERRLSKAEQARLLKTAVEERNARIEAQQEELAEARRVLDLQAREIEEMREQIAALREIDDDMDTRNEGQ